MRVSPWHLQLARFVVVGLANSAISFLAYALLDHVVSSPAAGAGAFALGAVNGFLLNRSWTFGSTGLTALPRYAVVQGAGAGATSLILWGWSASQLDHLAGYLAALVLVTPTTFALNRCWTFRARTRRAARAPAARPLLSNPTGDTPPVSSI
jgi:putative flippase GtrA